MFGFGLRKKRELPPLEAVFVSETGLVCEDNQDNVLVAPHRGVFCVADGMGGGAEGGKASDVVCRELKMTTHVAEPEFSSLVTAAQNALVDANYEIVAYARERGFAHMGSTAAILVFDPAERTRAAAIHVGDSRVYRIRRRTADLLTYDHTVGGQLGELTKGITAAGFKSRTNPLAHVLTRAIGAADKVEGEWKKIDVTDGDRFLICSDGVHDVVSDARIGSILSRPDDLVSASRRLTDEIVRNGAPDNFSYVMVGFGGAQ